MNACLYVSISCLYGLYVSNSDLILCKSVPVRVIRVHFVPSRSTYLVPSWLYVKSFLLELIACEGSTCQFRTDCLWGVYVSSLELTVREGVPVRVVCVQFRTASCMWGSSCGSSSKGCDVSNCMWRHTFVGCTFQLQSWLCVTACL